MKEFQHFKRETEQKLNRQLSIKEVAFMQWVFAQYLEEQQKEAQKAH